MLGNIIEKRNGFDIYLYPQINFTKEEKDKSTNIMVIGETGTGKSFWLHNLVNYIQKIQLEKILDIIYLTKKILKINMKSNMERKLQII